MVVSIALFSTMLPLKEEALSLPGELAGSGD